MKKDTSTSTKINYDYETYDYVEKLEKNMGTINKSTSLPFANNSFAWNQNKTRPLNSPQRRISGISLFIAKNIKYKNGFSKLLDTFIKKLIDDNNNHKNLQAAYKELLSKLIQKEKNYWGYRSVLNSARLTKLHAQIGKACAERIITNSFIPLVFLLADKNNNGNLQIGIVNLYSNIQVTQLNRVSRLMWYRLTGNKINIKSIITKESFQQGLIQIFFDFCDNNIKNCTICPLPELLLSFGEE